MILDSFFVLAYVRTLKHNLYLTGCHVYRESYGNTQAANRGASIHKSLLRITQRYQIMLWGLIGDGADHAWFADVWMCRYWLTNGSDGHNREMSPKHSCSVL